MNPAHLKTSALLRRAASELRSADTAPPLVRETFARELIDRAAKIERAADDDKSHRAHGNVGPSGHDVLNAIGEQP